MPRYIVKLTKGQRTWYLEWSTVVDAPATFGVALRQFTRDYLRRYGEEGMRELPERLKRVEKTGTSSALMHTVADLVSVNRAGPKETQLSLDEIIKWYCIKKREPS